MTSNTSTRFGLSELELSSLFPFAIGCDSEGVVRFVGASIQRLFPEAAPGTRLNDHFQLIVPRMEFSTEALKQAASQLVVLEKLGNGLRLKGQALFRSVEPSSSQILFLVAPQVTDIFEISRYNLLPSDFALHDPSFDFTLAIQSLKSSIEAADRSLAELKSAHAVTEEKLIQSAKMAALGQMAGGIAHEINNPLVVISGKAAILKRDLASGKFDLTKSLQIVEKIETTCLRISKIVRGMKTLSRDADRDPFVPSPLQTILDDTLELCRERCRQQGVELRISSVPALMLECRPVQISQALLNLIGNACDAVLCRDDKWVRLDFAEVREKLRVSITDSGAGIPAELAEKIMQPFFTTKEMGKGTGLGLSITRRIVEAHQGRLFLDTSSTNTRFVIELPRVQMQKFPSKAQAS